MLHDLYRVEEHNWWHAGMRRITLSLLAGATLPPGPLLEIGCGGGIMLRDLHHCCPNRLVVGTDLNRAGLQRRRGPAVRVFQADLHHLPLAAASCAGVIALDAFDQQGVELTRGLAESWRVLGAEGILLLRVSAYPWLYGPHDVAFGAGKRYTRAGLRAAVVAAGFAIERVSFANSLLLAPAVIMRLSQRAGWIGVARELHPPRPLGPLLDGALALERRWLRRHDFPAGLSLYAIARKPTQRRRA